MRRREFLKYLSVTGGASLVGISSSAWAVRNPGGARNRLVVVFLRGAVDGLNVVAPYGDKEYYSLRPSIEIARPGQSQGLLDLDGHFGLHPALAAVAPLWKERSLAFVHACGSPDESRSHFDAQTFMENGTPGVRVTPDGWLNRVLRALPAPHTATEAVNFGPTMPKILQGSMSVASLPPGRRQDDNDIAVNKPAVQSALDAMYNGSDALGAAYRQGRAAKQQFMSELQQDMTEAAGGAPSAAGFSRDADHLCTLVRHDPSIELAFFGLSGWDTHVSQGGAEGRLANQLHALAEGLQTLRTKLGDAYEDTVVLVISEFGRTAHENGDGGTDHGHGNVMWVMGGSVAGGKIYGEWPGLNEQELHEQRDLAITTDFRVPISTVLARHMKLSPQMIAGVFPNAPQPGAGVALFRT